jgi:SAM-dependent methyltransferase
MAPELALKTIATLPKDAIILDPMSGSGTVLRAGIENGNRCLGFDLDPLAVLMARVWTSHLTPGLVDEARKVVAAAKALGEVSPPWGESATTQRFAEFWFEERQRKDLSALAHVLANYEGVHRHALMLALSRLIITKEKGASIARDTSHSRPHRVFFNNDFDVFHALPFAAKRIEERLKPEVICGTAEVEFADARRLPLEDQSVDAVITSPPYLNAIDYMRGHRLALIWLGYTLEELATVRSVSIGAEAALQRPTELVLPSFKIAGKLSPPKNRIIDRYRTDIYRLMIELRRVVKPGGRVLVVVGNSNIAGTLISNADINHASATQVGFTLINRFDRALPPQSRYLPTPKGGSNALARRMRTETVLSFAAKE